MVEALTLNLRERFWISCFFKQKQPQRNKML